MLRLSRSFFDYRFSDRKGRHRRRRTGLGPNLQIGLPLDLRQAFPYVDAISTRGARTDVKSLVCY